MISCTWPMGVPPVSPKRIFGGQEDLSMISAFWACCPPCPPTKHNITFLWWCVYYRIYTHAYYRLKGKTPLGGTEGGVLVLK